MKFGSRFILFTTFLLILVAGIVVGRVWQRLPPPLAPGGGHSWLSDQLDLSPDQRQRMDAIWDRTRKEMGDAFQKRRELDRQRRQAILDLLTPPQKTEYERINKRFSQKRRQLDDERGKLVHQAETESRALLNADQQKTWDKMNSRWQQRRHRGQRGPHGGATRPASRPMPAASAK